MQRAVVRAVAVLDFESQVNFFVDCIGSESPGVSREASVVLRRRKVPTAKTALENLLRHSPHPHVRSNAFRVLQTHGNWARLESALLAVRSGDEALAERGADGLDRWLSNTKRSYAPPGSRETDEILALLESTGPRVAPSRLAQSRTAC